MSLSYIDDSLLTDIAGEIRTKLSSADTYTPAQMASAIASIPTGGGGGGTDPFALQLQKQNFDYVNYDLPASTNDYALPAYAFYNYTYMKNFEMGHFMSFYAGNIGSLFNGCTSLETAIIQQVFTTWGRTAFNNCTALKMVAIANGANPIKYKVGSSTKSLYGKGSQTYYDGSIGPFAGCSAMDTFVILPFTLDMMQRLIDTATALGTMTQYIVPLSSTNFFNGTKIANGNGTIYVPDADVSAYQSATNWATFASQITGISNLPAAYKTKLGLS